MGSTTMFNLGFKLSCACMQVVLQAGTNAVLLIHRVYCAVGKALAWLSLTLPVLRSATVLKNHYGRSKERRHRNRNRPPLPLRGRQRGGKTPRSTEIPTVQQLFHCGCRLCAPKGKAVCSIAAVMSHSVLVPALVAHSFLHLYDEQDREGVVVVVTVVG